MGDPTELAAAPWAYLTHSSWQAIKSNSWSCLRAWENCSLAPTPTRVSPPYLDRHREPCRFLGAWETNRRL